MEEAGMAIDPDPFWAADKWVRSNPLDWRVAPPGLTLDITEARIDGKISGEEARALWAAFKARRELTDDEAGIFWRTQQVKIDRVHHQMLKEAHEEAFWDDLLGILRKARAFMPGPTLEKTILEVKRRR